jgi:hypothetical protein
MPADLRDVWCPQHRKPLRYNDMTRRFACPAHPGVWDFDEEEVAADPQRFAPPSPPEPERIPGFIWVGTHYERIARYTDDDRARHAADAMRDGRAAARRMRARGEW